MFSTRKMVLGAVAVLAGFGAVALGARDSRAVAAVEPAQVTMLVCSTADDGMAILSGTSTIAGLEPKKFKNCAEVLKAVLDADQVVVDFHHQADGRVVVTVVNKAAAENFNVSRSNKDKG